MYFSDRLQVALSHQSHTRVTIRNVFAARRVSVTIRNAFTARRVLSFSTLTENFMLQIYSYVTAAFQVCISNYGRFVNIVVLSLRRNGRLQD